MTAKDREERPQTPTDLLADIRDALAGKVHLRASRAAPTRALPAAHPRHPEAGARHREAQAKSSSRTAWAFAATGALVLVAVVLFVLLRGGGAPIPPPVPAAQTAYEAAEAYAKEQPSDIDGAIAKFTAVATAHPDTDWAKKATAKVQDLERQRAAATQGQPDAQLAAAVASLKAQIAPLLGKDRFGDATKLVDAFARSHPGPAAAAQASVLKRTILQKAEARFGTLAGQADAAVEQKDYAKARAALKPVEAFGIPALAKDAEAKLAQIDALENAGQHTAGWDAIKARAADLAKAGNYDDALAALKDAAKLPIDGIADLIAEQTAAIDDARRAAVDKAVAAYQKESDKVWAFFKDRKYPEADKLLAALAATPEHKAAADHVKADLEAAKLLKDFWAAVERGITGRGKAVTSIAGAVGTIVSVKDGTITLKAGRDEYTRHIHQIPAKQAAGYAGLPTGPRSKLTLAVFLLAEQTDLPEAQKALDAAGEGPSVAAYRDRLAPLLLGAEELAARKAWQRIQQAAKGKLTKNRARSLLKLLDAFAAEHGGTKLFGNVRDDTEALRGRAAELAAVPKFFHGAVRRLRDGRLELRYDWSDPKQLTDWEAVGATRPVLVAGELRFGGGGSGALEHVAPFVGDVGLAGQWQLSEVVGSSTSCSMTICRTDAGSYGLLLRAGSQRLYKNHGTKAIRNLEATCPNGQWHTARLVRVGKSLEAWANGRLQVRVTDPDRTAGSLRLGSWNAKVAFKIIRIVGRIDRDWLAAHPAAPEQIAAAPLGRHPGTPARKPAATPKPGKWRSLFDGKTLGGWRIAEGGDYTGRGKVGVSSGALMVGAGKLFTGVAYTGEFPSEDYEVVYEARRVSGKDNFGNAVLPVGSEHVCLIVGGWGGSVVALHWLDGKPGNANATTKHMDFRSGRWYEVRARVTKARIDVWLDRRKLIDQPRAGHRFGLDAHCLTLRPFGFQTAFTAAALRNIRVRRLKP